MRFLIATGVILLISALLAGTAAGYDDDDYTKIFVVVLGIHEDTVDNEMVEIHYGHAPNIGLQQGNFTATIRAENGTALFSFDVWDPRYQLDDIGYHPVLAHHEQQESPNLESIYRAEGETEDVDLPVILPYHRDIRTVELRDKNTGALLISVNLSPAVEEFRARFPKDPDMLSHSSAGSASPQMPPASETLTLFIVGGVLGILLLAILAVMIRRT